MGSGIQIWSGYFLHARFYVLAQAMAHFIPGCKIQWSVPRQISIESIERL
jgi:hypothetical protein